jgi:hypothetical protein
VEHWNRIESKRTHKIFSRKVIYILEGKLVKIAIDKCRPLKVLTMYPGEEPSPMKLFFKFRTAERGFVGEGSSPGYTVRTFKGFVDFFILF